MSRAALVMGADMRGGLDGCTRIAAKDASGQGRWVGPVIKRTLALSVLQHPCGAVVERTLALSVLGHRCGAVVERTLALSVLRHSGGAVVKRTLALSVLPHPLNPAQTVVIFGDFLYATPRTSTPQ